MKIAVTGASGAFGRGAVSRLCEQLSPEQIIATTRSPDKLSAFASAGVDVRYADFDDADSLVAAFAGADRLLLISTDKVGNRVESHRNAILAAKKAGVSHIIYTSILGADREDNPAMVKDDHAATEAIIRDTGLTWNFLRDSQYAEAVAIAMAKFALETGEHVTSSGEGRASFVAREDCVDCAAALLLGAGESNRAYTPTGPRALSQREAMDIAARIAGTPITTRVVTTAERQAMYDAMGVARTVVDLRPDSPIPWVSEDMLSFDLALIAGIFDIVTDDVYALTGHPPKPLEEVLLENRALWLNDGARPAP